MTNMLNRISEKASTTVKKQAKNITLASALIATLASCGNKAENTTPNQIDSTKVEQVEKVDSIKTVIDNKINSTNEEKENVEESEILDLDDAAELAMQELEAENQPERKKLNFEDEKAYKACLKAQKIALEALELSLKGNEAFRAESQAQEGVESSLKICESVYKDLEQPLPEVYYQAKKLLEKARSKK